MIDSLTLVCPFIALGLGVLVTGDHFDARMLFGTAIALAGVLLILLKPRKAATCCQPLELYDAPPVTGGKVLRLAARERKGIRHLLLTSKEDRPHLRMWTGPPQRPELLAARVWIKRAYRQPASTKYP